MEFDPLTKSPAYQLRDTYTKTQRVNAEEIEEGIVRFRCKFSQVQNIGNVMIIKHEKRLNPAFFINQCGNIKMEDITIYHAATMGLIAQKSKNISLQQFNVQLRKETNRLVSACADATHFVNCTGTVLIEDCSFENQMDDVTNVHGAYTKIAQVLSEHSVETQIMHFQQKGVIVFSPGDKVQFKNPLTLLPFHEETIKESEMINQTFARLDFSNPLPKKILDGCILESVSSMPDLVNRNCRAGNNRARGFLVSTPGNVLIEKNVLYPGGTAIKVAEDANHWYESGAVKNVTIQENHFVDCGYGPWGKAVIDIDPVI